MRCHKRHSTTKCDSVTLFHDSATVGDVSPVFHHNSKFSSFYCIDFNRRFHMEYAYSDAMIWCNLLRWELFNFIHQSIWIGCNTIAWMVGLIKANHRKKWCVNNSLKRINCTKFFFSLAQTSSFPFSGSEIFYLNQKETICDAIAVQVSLHYAHIRFIKCVHGVRIPNFIKVSVSLSLCVCLRLFSLNMRW